MKCKTVVRYLVASCVTLLATNLAFNTTSVALAQQAASPLPAGVGRDVTMSTCSKCHSLANITSQRKDRDAWSATVTKMVGYGATGSDEDFAQIIDYLTKNFGKESSP